MALTSNQVRHVAKLASLPLTGQEEEKHTQQLSKILDYIEQLNGVDTSAVEPIYNVSGNANVARDDKVSKSLTQDQALANAPQQDKGFFVTKGVFENV